MFDYVFFVKTLSLIGSIVFGLLFCCSVYVHWYHESTELGRLEKKVIEHNAGARIVGYGTGKRFILFLMCIVTYFSIN